MPTYIYLLDEMHLPADLLNEIHLPATFTGMHRVILVILNYTYLLLENAFMAKAQCTDVY